MLCNNALVSTRLIYKVEMFMRNAYRLRQFDFLHELQVRLTLIPLTGYLLDTYMFATSHCTV